MFLYKILFILIKIVFIISSEIANNYFKNLFKFKSIIYSVLLSQNEKFLYINI